jgi:hypothetical protein
MVAVGVINLIVGYWAQIKSNIVCMQRSIWLAATGSPPPEIGGSFNITGDRYSAQGVFLGKQ